MPPTAAAAPLPPGTGGNRGAVGGQQFPEPVSRDLQDPGQLGPQPWQRLGLATFPTHHRSALDAQLLGKLFIPGRRDLTCIDPRTGPGAFLGIDLGDAIAYDLKTGLVETVVPPTPARGRGGSPVLPPTPAPAT